MARLYALQLADQRAMERQGVRENPIRRGGYSGGAAPTQPVRFELASERAEEIQANRTNPRRKGATPTMGVSRVRGGKKGDAHYEHDREGKLLHETMEAHEAEGRAMKGGRAVPSAGLSQFRGGAMERMVGAGKGSESDSCDSDSSEEYEGGARDMEVLAREKAPRPAIRSGLSAQHSAEAKEMGHHLGKHLIAVRGGGFFDLFTKGIVEAGQQGESFAKQTGEPNANPPPPPTGIMTTTTPPAEAKGGALFHRKRDMLGEKEEAHEEHTARRFGMTRKGGYLSGQYEGMGESGGKKQKTRPSRVARRALKTDEERDHEYQMTHNEHYRRHPEHRADMMRLGDLPAHYPQQNPAMYQLGVYAHPPVNQTPPPSDDEMEIIIEGSGESGGAIGSKNPMMKSVGGARAARAAIVKKVMAEKGCSMIEASKYVKAHGLYKGGTRSKAKPSKKEKNPYGRTHTSEMSLGKMKKVKKPAAAPAPAQPDLGLAIDLPPPPPKGKGRRAPAGPNDGRRKRAEIVKKVMAEKGMKMIEASKYVKAHGLY